MTSPLQDLQKKRCSIVDRAPSPDLAYYVHADRLGSVMLLVDGNGAIEESYRYEEFGSTVIVDGNFAEVTVEPHNSPVGNPYRYTGRRQDIMIQQGVADDDWYYSRARNLRTEVGRFVVRDSMVYIDGANVYMYALQSPLNLRDPMGLSTLVPCGQCKWVSDEYAVTCPEGGLVKYTWTLSDSEKLGGDQLLPCAGGNEVTCTEEEDVALHMECFFCCTEGCKAAGTDDPCIQPFFKSTATDIYGEFAGGKNGGATRVKPAEGGVVSVVAAGIAGITGLATWPVSGTILIVGGGLAWALGDDNETIGEFCCTNGQ